MRVAAFRNSLLIAFLMACILPQTSSASSGDCDELLGGNCHAAPVAGHADEPQPVLTSSPDAKPKSVEQVPIIARAKTAEKREISVSASLERSAATKIRAVSERQEQKTSEPEKYKPAPYPKGNVSADRINPPLHTVSAPDRRKPQLVFAPDYNRAIPALPRTQQALVSLPPVRLTYRKEVIPGNGRSIASPPYYQPEKIVDLQSVAKAFQVASPAIRPEPVSQAVAPAPRVEIQLADPVQRRERLAVSIDFRQIETRAENECMAYFGGRPASETYFMNCMGETVESLVYATRRPELIRYFQSLLAPQLR